MRILLGTRTLAQAQGPDDSRMSLAFFCGKCGDIWGRVQRSDSWQVLGHRPCGKHADPYHIGGSFFQWGYEWQPRALRPFLTQFPDLAAHEFKVAMSWAEKFLDEPEGSQQQELEL